MQTLTAELFGTARYPVALESDEIQLWFFPGPDAVAGSTDACVVALLAAYLGCSSDNLTLRRGEHGKPYLVPHGTLEFNLSHSAGGLLIGISRQQALGVDVERLTRVRPALELAQRFFHPEEAAALAALDRDGRQRAFLQLWSCKEAVVKALGRGIGFGLERVAFALDRGGAPDRLNVIAGSALTAQEWHIAQLEPASGWIGALAWNGPPRPIRAFIAAPAPAGAADLSSVAVAGATQSS
jgi:4'-phosphopantetheinyl transferase